MLKAGALGRTVLQLNGKCTPLGSLFRYSTTKKTVIGSSLDKKVGDAKTSSQRLHVTAKTEYPMAKAIPLPNNVEDIVSAERFQFSQHRERDISGPMIICREPESWRNVEPSPVLDPRVQSYDCHNSVSLNCTMQTNVPQPFSAEGKATHLNMPGGQWDRGDRWVSQDMQELHCRSGVPARGLSSTTSGTPTLTGKERLKAAVRDYGATVVVFHVGISLLSLGAFYTAVSSGLDMTHWLSKMGIEAGEVAAGASTFVVAYAIHKVFAPLRIGITLASAPFIVRYLRGIGFLKPPKPK